MSHFHPIVPRKQPTGRLFHPPLLRSRIDQAARDLDRSSTKGGLPCPPPNNTSRCLTSTHLLILAASAIGIVACGGDRRSARGPLGLAVQAPVAEECPQDSIPLSGSITHVVGFHDCQRFVRGTSYDSVYAIFASAQLATVASRVQSAGGAGIPAAEIYSRGGTYEPLGIEPGYNCLYFFEPAGQLRAKTVPLGPSTAVCDDPLADPGAARGKELEVRQVTVAGLADADYPPVTRWQSDPVNLGQYIGIKCGAAWCEVGNTGFKSESALLAGTGRTYSVPGWYDEQVLAVPAADGSLRPSGVRAAIYPAADLGQHNDAADFSGRWVQAATVVLEARSPDYESKLNFDPGSNRIFLCIGSSGDCQVSELPPRCTAGADNHWWAKIVSASGRVAYRCVTHRDHSGLGVDIPGGARWRWAVDDETGWARCTNGCCQIQ